MAADIVRIVVVTPGDYSVGMPAEEAVIHFSMPQPAELFQDGHFQEELRKLFCDLWDNCEVWTGKVDEDGKEFCPA
jgi:hypothetical protein